MKKKIFCLILLATIVIFPSFVDSHTTKYSGDIGILLHMHPDDDPIARQPAILYFHFTDEGDKFKPELCDCRVTISQNGTVLLTEKLLHPNDLLLGSGVLSADFIFPSRGIYKIDMEGTALNGEFEPISVSFDQRVEREAMVGIPMQEAKTHWLHYIRHHFLHVGFFGFAILLTLGIVYRDMKFKKRYNEGEVEEDNASN